MPHTSAIQHFLLLPLMALFLSGLLSGCDSGSSSNKASLLGTPYDLSASQDEKKNGELTLSWQKVEGATSYTIAYYESGESSSPIKVADIEDTSYTFSMLKPEGSYVFTVAAHNSAGAGTPSETFSFTLELRAPSTPGKPRVVEELPDNGDPTTITITISWDAVPTAASYTLKCTPNPSPSIGDLGSCRTIEGITGTEHSVSKLTIDNKEYSFLLVAHNSAGDSDQSEALVYKPSLTSPPAPENLAVNRDNSGDLLISWALVSEATSYTLKYTSSTDSGTTTKEDVTSVYRLSGLETGVTYSFTITAHNSAGSSADSAAVRYTLAAPAAFAISSNTFTDGGAIPDSMAAACNTAGATAVYDVGTNTSPHLSWSNAPTDTAGLVVIMDDETSPCGTGTGACKHWSQALPSSSQTSIAAGDATSYIGPYPPLFSPTHTYTIEIFALSKAAATIVSTINRAEFRAGDYSNDILVSATMTGVYTLPSQASNPSPATCSALTFPG